MNRTIGCLAVTVLVLLLGVLPAAAGDVNTLNVGFYIEPTSFDPHIVTSTDIFIVWNIYEPLVDLNRRTMQLEPALATSWEISKDLKTYTFKLRRGVRFHDGSSFTAQDVRASIERIKHFKRGSSWLLQAVKEVKVVDDHTAQVVLTQPDIAFQKGLPFIYIVSAAAIKKHEEAAGDLAPKWFMDYSAGTGPYRIVKWTRGEKLELAKFDDYWRGWKKPHLSKVVYWVVLETGTQRLMVEKGDLDIPLIYTADDVEGYRKNPTVNVDMKPGAELMYIRLHNQAGPTKDKRIRQALSLAFDWKTFEVVMRGQVAPSDGPVPSELLGGWKPNGILREYNLDKARKLLAEAGYPKGFRMSYLYNKGDEEKRIMGEVWRAGLQKIGVELDIKIMTWPAMVERLSGWGDTRDAATAENSYGQYTNPRIPDAYAFLYFMYHSAASKGAGRNFMYYANPEADSLIVRAAAAPSEEERIKLYREASEIIVRDVPDIFVYKIPDISVRRKVVQGFRHNPIARRAYDFYELHKTGP
jgi:peptide/nickel transport system substrate-binding protein